MFPKVVSVPLRIGLRVTRVTLVLSAKLAVRVAGEVVHVTHAASPASRPAPSAPAAASRTSAPAEPAPATDPAAATDPSSPPPAAPEAPAASSNGATADAWLDSLPDTPITREAAEAKTIDDSDEVVAEFAETGAEDGAGAQIAFDEPWEGYDAANVEAVSARLASADAAELAVVELYEQTHKARKTVLDAAARRLKELSPPN